MQFGNMDGLYLLAFLIPLIIIYLIKAKPKDITIPSLMFFTDDKKVKKYNAFLRKLLLKLLFFLQLLIIVIIALAASNPLIEIPMDAYSLNTVVIMDVSASMQTKDTTMQRIDIGKDSLLNFLKGRTSIILAEETPIVLASNVSSSRAKALITNLESKDIKSRVDSSIILANDLLGEDRGTIVVYSDFMLNKNDDILAAKKIAEANDKRVIFIESGKRQTNVGFVTLNLNRGNGEAFIKNFADADKTIDVKLVSGKEETKRIEISPYSVEKISFEVGKGETTLEVLTKDRLLVDNKIFIMNPYESDVNILLITNKKTKSALRDALESNPNFNVQVTMPPVIPDMNHDVVVISDIQKSMLLPNTFRDIKKYRDEGGKVIIASQEDIDKFDFQGLVDFGVGQMKSSESNVIINISNEFTSNLIGRADGFSSVSRYYDIDIKEDSSVVLASSISDGEPIFIMENGLFFYGIIDDFSGFKEQIDYPLFWDDLINYMLGKKSLANFNFKTGDVFVGGNETDKAILNKVGIFDVNGREIAVNLLSDAESDIFEESMILNNSEYAVEYEKVNLEVNIDVILLVLALLLFVYELYYIKRRGDL